MLSVLFGCGAVLFGLWGMWTWNADFMQFLKGMGPVSLFFAGLIAILMGLSRSSSRKTPPASKKK